jgi:hypothetical protein
VLSGFLANLCSKLVCRKKSLAVAVDLKQDAIPMAEFLQQYQHA